MYVQIYPFSRLKNKDNFIYQIILALVNVNMQVALCYVFINAIQVNYSTVISIHSKCFDFNSRKMRFE